MKKINVIALESSGRHWVDSLLRQNPELEVWGASFPYDPWPDRRYLPLPEDADALVVVVRDRNCQEKSVQNRDYNQGAPEGEFTPDKNRAAIEIEIARARQRSLPVYFFDYEAALLYRQTYLDWFFRLLGVPPVTIQTDWRDENRKYFYG